MRISCDWCGKEFERKPSQVKTRNYCGYACLGKANSERFRIARLRTCDNCGVEFDCKPGHKARNKHFFCTRECGYAFKSKKKSVKCDWCEKEFPKKKSDIKRSKYNFCSVECCLGFKRWTGLTGRGVIVDGVYIHRKIIEDAIGRTLTSDEEVHHIDFNHHNNRLENLIILSKSEHSKIHAARKERDKSGRFVKTRADA